MCSVCDVEVFNAREEVAGTVDMKRDSSAV